MDWIWPLLAAPFVGSFSGVLIRRLPEGRLLVPARSCCEACGVALGWRDLVPLVSFVVLRGRCRSCGAAIAAQHWHIEVAAVAVAGSAGLAGAPWTACVFGWAALALAWIDWDWMLLPDAITLPLVLAGLAATEWTAPWLVTDHAIAAALGYSAVQALAWGYRRLRGAGRDWRRGRKVPGGDRGMGGAGGAADRGGWGGAGGDCGRAGYAGGWTGRGCGDARAVRVLSGGGGLGGSAGGLNAASRPEVRS